MSNLEIKRINDLEFQPIEFADKDLVMDLELGLMTTPISKIVVKRLDNPTVRTCKICEFAHEGLYCTNCFTGERVRVGARKFAKVIRLHEIRKEN
jgi:hypothetical protein